MPRVCRKRGKGGIKQSEEKWVEKFGLKFQMEIIVFQLQGRNRDQRIDTQLVQGPCVVHGRAGKGIFSFSLSIVPVKNVFLLNHMEQAHGFLEKGPLSSHGH